MKLSKYLAEIFEEEFEFIFQKEKSDNEFLNHEEFEACRDRAKKAIDLATEKVVNTLALSIAAHREKDHGDNTIAEQAVLLDAGADPEIGTMSFWNE